MTREDCDVRTLYDDRSGVAGYVWQKRRRTSWNATLFGFFETLRAAEASDLSPSPPRPPIKAGSRR